MIMYINLLPALASGAPPPSRAPYLILSHALYLPRAALSPHLPLARSLSPSRDSLPPFPSRASISLSSLALSRPLTSLFAHRSYHECGEERRGDCSQRGCGSSRDTQQGCSVGEERRGGVAVTVGV